MSRKPMSFLLDILPVHTPDRPMRVVVIPAPFHTPEHVHPTTVAAHTIARTTVQYRLLGPTTRPRRSHTQPTIRISPNQIFPSLTPSPTALPGPIRTKKMWLKIDP